MNQSRRVSPSESLSFTTPLPNRSGGLEDLSSKSLAATVYAPSGAQSSWTALGLSTGSMTVSGSVPNETGTHKLFLWVDGERRAEINLIASGPASTAGTAQISITADRTTVTADMV